MSAPGDSTAREHDHLSEQDEQRVKLMTRTGSEYKPLSAISDEWKEGELQKMTGRMTQSPEAH